MPKLERVVFIVISLNRAIFSRSNLPEHTVQLAKKLDGKALDWMQKVTDEIKRGSDRAGSTTMEQ
jgi:hypothetical protein